ncbi:MAG: DUF1015 family protein [Verrucomicrobia bacterium]|nr:DUF1015 family protein [Verrucomicrobiota bacterium]
MAIIRPFAALRPAPELASRICELPYDVVSTDEARALAAGNPLSFFHVSKPEIDLEPALDPYDPRVYARGAENLRRLIREGAVRQDAEPCFYLYRQIMGEHVQTGLVAAASCQDYLSNVIKRHELTRPDKEDDRVRHIEALDAQTGPVFLAYQAPPALATFLAQKIAGPPAVDFVATDGVRHSSWTVSGASDQEYIRGQLEKVDSVYIADGHHRCAAAARVFRSRQGRGNSPFFLAVLFPHDQLQILPYHRVLSDRNGLAPAQLLEKLESVFAIEPDGTATPRRQHELGLFFEDHWRTLTFRPAFTATTDPLERLDVTLLQRHVLAPVFGIDDPRTSHRIHFVGGIRGPRELERLVRGSEDACAFSMFPTRIEDLMAIADGGRIMPPKSTWFEPKLRDAMFCHLL